MLSYRTAWRSCCTAVAALGLGTALLVWPALLSLVIFLMAGFVTGLVRELLRPESAIPAEGTAVVASWCTWVAQGGALGVAFGGLTQISLGLALFVSSIAGATSPPAVARVRDRLRSPAAPIDEPGLAGLTEAELCLAWRRSYGSLLAAPSVQMRAAIVRSRQLYLDELERRDPAGLGAWLSSGARAAGGPDKYIRPDRPDPATAA